MIVPISLCNDRASQRILEVRDAMATHEIKLAPDRLLKCPYSIADARRRFRALMSGESRPTAVICGNDILALSALVECKALDLEVPGDVSITGFADLEFAAHFEPGLTTMHIPAEDMGRCAAEYVLARLSGEPVPSNTEFEASLIVRGTTSPPGAPVRRRGPRRRL